MGGSWRQAPDFLNQLFPADLSRFFCAFAFDQLGDGRSASHRRNTAFGAEANVGYSLFQFRLFWTICLFQFKAQFQNVSANRVFQTRRGVGIVELTGVSWILKMIEKFGGIHRRIVMRRLAISGSVLNSFTTKDTKEHKGNPPSPTIRSMPDSRSPRRIACLQPSATVILASVGELDRVVACTKYCSDVVPELLTDLRSGERLIVIIADSWTSKASEILAAKPDLVIAAVPYQEAAVVEILKAGIRFLGLAPRTLDDIYTDIALISGSVGAGERGAKVISEMQAAIAEVRHQTTSLPRKRVFCEEWGKPIIASQPWVAELVDAAGGDFLGKPGAQCSAEEIARLDPEVIIAAWCGAGDRVPLARITSAKERGWSNTTAVRNSQVYCISDELLNTPAPTLVAGLRALASAIHPAMFGLQAGLRSVTQVPRTQTLR